jgi:hypothetical protein
MEPDGRTYLLPHPWPVRAALTLAGGFVLLIAPWELWRGFWPLNLTSPFFAIFLIGGMSIGAAFVWAGLAAPSSTLRFSPGLLEIELVTPWRKALRTVPAVDIDGFEVEESPSSDGPDEFFAMIRTRSGQPVRSRPLGSRAAAERQLAEFRRALEM